MYKVTPRYGQFYSGNLKENLDFLLSPASIATTVQGMPGANVSPDPYHQMFRRESLDEEGLQPAGDKTGPRGSLGGSLWF